MSVIITIIHIVEDHRCVSREELRSLVTRIARELKYGDISFSNESTAPNWDVPSSIFFASTVVTTIGMALNCFQPAKNY